jgi:hypothetical protein
MSDRAGFGLLLALVAATGAHAELDAIGIFGVCVFG